MTPRDVETLTGEEYDAMIDYVNREQRERQREARRARRR